MRFRDGLEKYLNSNKLTIVVMEKSSMGEEPELPTNSEIPKVKVTLEKGYYQGVYINLYFKKFFLK